MEDFGHDFVFISHIDLYKYPDLEFMKIKYQDQGVCYVCNVCNMFIYRSEHDGNSFYAGKGVDKENIVNITCTEYTIKKLLE